MVNGKVEVYREGFAKIKGKLGSLSKSVFSAAAPQHTEPNSV